MNIRSAIQLSSFTLIAGFLSSIVIATGAVADSGAAASSLGPIDAGTQVATATSSDSSTVSSANGSLSSTNVGAESDAKNGTNLQAQIDVMKTMQPMPIVVVTRKELWPNQVSLLSAVGLDLSQNANSRDISVCTVSASGMVTPVKAGQCLIDITHPADASHLKSTRTVEITILAPTLTARPSTKVPSSFDISISIGPNFAKKLVEVWQSATGKTKARLISQVKLDSMGSATVTRPISKHAILVIKYKGTTLTAMNSLKLDMK